MPNAPVPKIRNVAFSAWQFACNGLFTFNALVPAFPNWNTMAEILELDASASVGKSLVHLLDKAFEAINGQDAASLSQCLRELHDFRRGISDEEGFQAAQLLAQSHEVFPILLEDPYTRHAFTKPRGIAGDASLIDLFYGHRSGLEAETPAGRLVFETLMRSGSCDAVRYRRGYYGAFIDRIAETRPKARVLALACGHLREAMFSKAVSSRSVQLVGLDSDPLAVQEAERSLGPYGVELRAASVIDFVRRRAWGENYDAIYAAGLFDYLEAKIGRKVISSAFSALRPGGTLSVANFLPNIVELGYMDLIMDWRLIYRTPDEMKGLATGIPHNAAEIETWTDPLERVVYLTVTKNP